MNQTLNSHLARAICLTTLLVLSSATELRAQDENAPPPQGRGAVRGAAVVPVDRIAKPVLEGRIVDDRGDPVSDARISLRTVGLGIVTIKTARTDENGHYQFNEIDAPGEFRLEISSKGWLPPSEADPRQTLTLSRDSRMVRDFKLQRACQIRVQVMNELLEPVPRARVYFQSDSKSDTPANGDRNRQGVLTDSQGIAILGSIPQSNERYTIIVTSENYAYGRLLKTLDDPIIVADGLVTLTKGEEVTGTLTAADGKPADGWAIIARPDWWRLSQMPLYSTVAEDGTFTIPHVATGKYDMEIKVPQGEITFRTPAGISGITFKTEAGPQGIALPAPEPLALKSRFPSRPPTVPLAAQIRFAGERPQQLINVYVRSEDSQYSTGKMLQAGQIAFDLNVPAGKYTLEFTSPNIEKKIVRGVTAPSDDLNVELVYKPTTILRGVAVRADNGQPVTNFWVRIAELSYLRPTSDSTRREWRNFSHPIGEFELPLLGPANCQIQIATEGLALTLSPRLNTNENGDKPVRVELPVGVELTGTFVDEQGRPIDGAQVLPLSRADASLRDLHKDSAVKTTNGRFTVSHLTPGKDSLFVTHPDFCFTIAKNIDVPEGGSEIAPITLTTGGTLRGRVYDVQGQPQPGVALQYSTQLQYVRLVSDTLNRTYSAVSDAEGRYEIKHVPEATGSLRRTAGSRSLGVSVNSVLTANGQTRELNLGGPNKISGRLLINGQPIARANLRLAGESNYMGSFEATFPTDDDGAFAFFGLPPGVRTLYYRDENDSICVRALEITPTTTDLGTIDEKHARLSVRREPAVLERRFGDSSVYLRTIDTNFVNSRSVGRVKNPETLGEPFVIDHVPPGKYEILVQLPIEENESRQISTWAVMQTVEVSDKAEQEITIRVPEGTASVRGRLPEAGLGRSTWLRLLSKDGRITGSFPSYSDRTFEMRNLPAGDYRLTAGEARDAAAFLEFALADGEEKVIDVTADKIASANLITGNLYVRTFTSQHSPLPGCEFTLSASKVAPKVVVGDDGFAEIIGPPGSYELTIAFPGFTPERRQITLTAPDAKSDPADDLRILNVSLSTR